MSHLTRYFQCLLQICLCLYVILLLSSHASQVYQQRCQSIAIPKRLRHPGQMLYGGFSQVFATLLLGGFGLLFLAGMGLWLLVLPHVRRTTVMLIALGGLSASIVGLTTINGLGCSLSGSHALLALLLLVVLGVLLLSGFTPAITESPGSHSRTAAGQTREP